MNRPTPRPWRTALALVATTMGLALVAPSTAQASTQYSAPLMTAIGDLAVASEVRTGYDRSLFAHWVDADGDGCNARAEVLISEADDAPTIGSGCSLSGGRWFSYYDRVSVSPSSGIDIDHMVPLAEAWDSGARSWSSTRRKDFANDLGDSRSLVGVTATSNRSKGDQDPAEWLPQYDVCRYVREYVAVKIRWGLSIDSTEKSALTSRGSGCTNTTITVTVV